MTDTLDAPVAPDVASRAYRTVNPATGELVSEHPRFTEDEAEAALARAHAAFATWSKTPLSERVALFRTMADLMEARAEDLARATTLEMGKPLGMSLMEVGLCTEMFRHFADKGPEYLADEVHQVDGYAHTVTRRTPMGVVLGIEPWNVPLYQALRAAIPNLMLGNTVVLKPSEICAASTLMLDDLFAEAGFPDGVYQTVLIGTEQASAYIADPRVRAVTLTGSDRAGSAVGEQAGRHIKPVVLELGGSDAYIVLDDADVQVAAATAAMCRLVMGGQVCASPKRLIVTDAVADEFIATFSAVFGNQVVGDPFDPATTVGPLSSNAAADGLQAQYADAVAKGATVLVEGGRVEGPGAFFRPAALTDLTPEMRVWSEEAFGPLALIFRVPDADAAIELANSSVYGLGGTVFSQDPEEAMRVAEALDTGAVGINSWFGAPVHVGFGGTKRSGVGRELGRYGMDAFANFKTYGIAASQG